MIFSNKIHSHLWINSRSPAHFYMDLTRKTARRELTLLVSPLTFMDLARELTRLQL